MKAVVGSLAHLERSGNDGGCEEEDKLMALVRHGGNVQKFTSHLVVREKWRLCGQNVGSNV